MALGFMKRGALFDLAILAANLWPVPYLARLAADGSAMPWYGSCLILAVALYSLGAWLKRAPLQTRLAARQPPPLPTAVAIALFVLIIMQGALFVFALMLGLENLGLPVQASPWGALVTVGVSLLPVGLTIRALVPIRAASAAPHELGRREGLADLALYAAALVMLSIWNSLFIPVMQSAHVTHWLAGLMLAALITVPFAMFYLGPRLLLLAEDWRHPTTWGSVLLAMLPLSLRLIF